MLSHPPRMSNAERQRQFRLRNPGYYGRLHRRRRAATKAAALEVTKALAAQFLTAKQAAAEAVQRQPLLLPAPVEAIEIPGMSTIPTMAAIRAMAEIPVLAVQQAATSDPINSR